MFFMFARKSTSKASPTTGMAPIVVSRCVGEHPRNEPARRAKLAGFPNEIRRYQTRNHITRDRYQADDPIKSEANSGAGENEGAIHQTCKRLETSH